MDRAQSALDNNPHVPARHVRLEANAGRLILRGAVRTFFQKQMAQEALRMVEGTHEIDNQLEVHWAS
ncbi:MAG: BON domain-containing protein [Planctomycetaceae bacterium]|nr:BON domain-containing protein [Planctomycetaceae bacterium]